MGFASAPVSRLVLLALALTAVSSAGAAFEIPHRGGTLRADGDGIDWRGEALNVELEAPRDGDGPRARARVRIAWDGRALWALFEVSDPTPSWTPAAAGGATLFQWDSVELYIDGRGDRERRMGTDDFQVILAPDGRFAVLQGDPLLHELEAMEVPKRERPSVVIETSGRRTADGYVIECAIPFAAVGIAPRPGLELALDLAINDWTAPHPPLDQLDYDLETLHKLEQASHLGESVFDRNGLAIASAREFEAEHYRPWAWSGSGDFGHPTKWRRVQLVGAPPLAESLVSLLGAGRTLLLGGLLTALLVALAAFGSERRHRRRIARLLDRITHLESARPAVSEAPAAPASERAPAAASDPIEWLERAAEHDAPGGDAHRPLELRAIRKIRDGLSTPLRPAELARALFVSLRTLERHLTEALACSPGELILAVKMREARRLLERSALQVQEIARRVGYDDPAHFSRRFKAYFGVAPAVFAAARAEAPGRARSVA